MVSVVAGASSTRRSMSSRLSRAATDAVPDVESAACEQSQLEGGKLRKVIVLLCAASMIGVLGLVGSAIDSGNGQRGEVRKLFGACSPAGMFRGKPGYIGYGHKGQPMSCNSPFDCEATSLSAYTAKAEFFVDDCHSTAVAGFNENTCGFFSHPAPGKVWLSHARCQKFLEQVNNHCYTEETQRYTLIYSTADTTINKNNAAMAFFSFCNVGKHYMEKKLAGHQTTHRITQCTWQQQANGSWVKTCE